MVRFSKTYEENKVYEMFKRLILIDRPIQHTMFVVDLTCTPSTVAQTTDHCLLRKRKNSKRNIINQIREVNLGVNFPFLKYLDKWKALWVELHYQTNAWCAYKVNRAEFHNIVLKAVYNSDSHKARRNCVGPGCTMWTQKKSNVCQT